MTYAEQIRSHLRLAILQTLEISPGYGVHEYLLLERIQSLGLGTTRDALLAELAWLKETGLITTEDFPEAQVAHLTGRGVDAARGLALVPGVARPRP
jgi:hypothetical protein